jgi:hypothetical protein
LLQKTATSDGASTKLLRIALGEVGAVNAGTDVFAYAYALPL